MTQLDALYAVMMQNDEILLYGIFAIQCCVVFIGFPLLMHSCCNEKKRVNLGYGGWFIKFVIVCLFTKWLIETYDIVEKHNNKKEEKGNKQVFDPYKLLHIANDGSFDTEEITFAFNRLAEKYHPSKVNADKVPYNKAVKRWENLVKAHRTLTNKRMYSNW